MIIEFLSELSGIEKSIRYGGWGIPTLVLDINLQYHVS